MLVEVIGRIAGGRGIVILVGVCVDLVLPVIGLDVALENGFVVLVFLGDGFGVRVADGSVKDASRARRGSVLSMASSRCNAGGGSCLGLHLDVGLQVARRAGLGLVTPQIEELPCGRGQRNGCSWNIGIEWAGGGRIYLPLMK